jgi:hypothetical protein
MAVDEAKLNDFLGQFVTDLGATANAAMVVIGHRLGLYRALAGAPPLTAGELAERTGTTPRYVTEWLAAQAASGYVTVAAEGRFTVSAEQAFALADPDGPLYVPGAFVLALASLKAEPRISEAFRTGAGLAWHEQDTEVFDGCEQFFAPGYRANLVQSWIPALDEVDAKLRRGAKVADVGCGHGASTGSWRRRSPPPPSPGTTTTPGRSNRRAKPPQTPGCLTGCGSRSRPRTGSRAPATT